MHAELIERLHRCADRAMSDAARTKSESIQNTLRDSGRMLREAAAALSAAQEPGWFLPAFKVNDIQVASIIRQITRCKQAHYTNLQIRVNGEYEYEQADWIKHMVALPPGAK